MIREILEDMEEGISKEIISAKFHNTIGDIIFDVSMRIREQTGINKVLISGGCFQNKYLVNYLEDIFDGSKLKLFKHKKYSPTDLGICVGQAVVASNIKK